MKNTTCIEQALGMAVAIIVVVLVLIYVYSTKSSVCTEKLTIDEILEVSKDKNGIYSKVVFSDGRYAFLPYDYADVGKEVCTLEDRFQQFFWQKDKVLVEANRELIKVNKPTGNQPQQNNS